MVLEFFSNVKLIRKNPIPFILLVFVINIISMFLAKVLIEDHSSTLAISFTIIAFVPFINKLYSSLEEDIVKEQKKGFFSILERNFSVVLIYFSFFIGVVLSYAFAYSFLRPFLGENLFLKQEEAINSIAEIKMKIVQGKLILPKGDEFFPLFLYILNNNSIILGLAILFSFVYGAGALFLISWQASIIGTLLGQYAEGMKITIGFGKVGVIVAFAYGIYKGFGFVPHGIFELSAYFIGAIAGGIISAAIAKGKWKKEEFEYVAYDALILIIIAYILLALGAFIESILILG